VCLKVTQLSPYYRDLERPAGEAVQFAVRAGVSSPQSNIGGPPVLDGPKRDT
jgi:hypothetical protein